MEDWELMAEAIGLSRIAVETGHGGPFGAVVAKDGSIVGKGCNRVLADTDPTAHAEVVAIRQACLTLQSFSLEGCALYASCEPCPMCLAAIYWARIDTVYYANTRRDAAAIGFIDNDLYREFSMDPALRRVRMQQMMRAEAQDAFRLWMEAPDKTPY